MIALLLGGGVLALWIGGEAFLRGSVAIASRFAVSHLLIGLTLVGFGTSLPELVTSVTAALNGSPGLSVGNVVGSNIANVLLVLGVAAAIRPVACKPEAFYRDAAALGAATVLGAVLILFGHIGRGSGLLLVAGIVAYIAFVYRQERRHPGPAAVVLAHEAEAVEPAVASLATAGAMTIGGLVGVIAGAWLVVTGAMELATQWGVSRTLIGLTIVAIGTSLPELVISAIASIKGQSDVALGNIIGSNMFNILAILGVTATVTPIDVPPDLRLLDVAVMIGATVLLLVSAATRLQVTRWEGAFFLLAYVTYTVMRASIAI